LLVEEELAVRIGGEVVLSSEPGKTIRKWREIFSVSQTELARRMGFSASVLSDYEGGRRSPGSSLVRKIVETLIELDSESGSKVIRAYDRASTGGFRPDVFLDIREFSSPIKAGEIGKIVKGEVVANPDMLEKEIYGYTAVDSLKAILELSSDEFLKIYGLTSERALIFTKVSSGRSPFVAIRVSSIKPGLVVLHGLDEIDPLAIKIAEKEKIPVLLSKFEDVNDLIGELRRKTN